MEGSARREGFTVNTLPIRVPASSRDELISQIEKAVTPRTKVIAVTHLTSTTGILFPAREIAEIARKPRHLDASGRRADVWSTRCQPQRHRLRFVFRERA